MLTDGQWGEAVERFLTARGTRCWRDYERDEASSVVQQFCGTRYSRVAWFARALAHPDRKWFVAFLAQRASRMSPRLYEPMLRAAIDEPNPSLNRTFVDPCVRAMGVARVVEDLLEVIRAGTDADSAGAARALYWAWRPRHQGVPMADDKFSELTALERRVLLTAFVTRTDVRLRQCIIGQLKVDPRCYPDDLRPLVSEAISIARDDDDGYIRHRIEVQLGNERTFKPLP